MDKIEFSVSILLRKEGVGDQSGWVAQCLEYDIASQGETIAEANITFEKTFVGQILVDIANKKQPLEGIQKAPKEYWHEFKKGEQLADHRRPFYLPETILPPFVIQAVANDMRVM